jgi:hypothetical protein
MSLWKRLRRASRSGEHPAADWYAAGSPLPDDERRVDGLAFEVAQVLAIKARRGAVPWVERQALVERVVTGPRWGDASYRLATSDDECRVTDAFGTVLLTLRHDAATDGHVIERYDRGRAVETTRYDDRGRDARRR